MLLWRNKILIRKLGFCHLIAPFISEETVTAVWYTNTSLRDVLLSVCLLRSENLLLPICTVAGIAILLLLYKVACRD